MAARAPCAWTMSGSNAATAARIAAEHGIELSALHGSGIAGRVTKRDLLQFLESGAAAPVARTPMPASAPSWPPTEAWPGDVVEPMSKMRQLISEHMVASRHTSAHVSSFFEVDFTHIARIRAKFRAEFERTTGEKLTYLPFIIKAAVDGLKRWFYDCVDALEKRVAAAVDDPPLLSG